MSGVRIEYRPAGAAPLGCGCPRLVHLIDRPGELLKVWHRAGCAASDLRSTVPAPPPPRPAPGAVPCPCCGNVVFSRPDPGRPARRCDGPAGCGHLWTPGRLAARAASAATELEVGGPGAVVQVGEALTGAVACHESPAPGRAASASASRPYVPGGADHARPWSPPRVIPMTQPASGPGYIVAGRPGGIGIQHLFRRAGEWSLCREAVWLEVQRAERVSELTWICARCKVIAGDGRRLWEAVS